MKPIGTKTRSIASLYGIKKPEGMDDLVVGCHCTVIRVMYLYFDRANAKRPYMA
jgi:hypothetical protein